MPVMLQLRFAYEKWTSLALLFVLICISVAKPVQAFSPAAPCGWLVGERRFSEPSDWKDVVESDESTYPKVEEAWPKKKEANDFVSFSFGGKNSWNVGLQHCPSGKGLLIFTTPKSEDAVRDEFSALMADSAPMTMGKIAAEMRELGASTAMRTGGIGECACEKAKEE